MRFGSRTFQAAVVLVPASILTACVDSEPFAVPEASEWDWTGIMTGASLSCTPGSHVSFNETLSCSIHTAGFAYYDVEEWEFDFGIMGVTNPKSSSSNPFWSGPVVHSGTVKVTGTVDGVPTPLSADIVVTRRSGWSWADSVKGRQGTPGEIDACFQPGNLARTLGRSCTAQAQDALFSPVSVLSSGGFTAVPVSGSGPNGGVFYVVDPTIVMDLRTQISREFRADADTMGLPMVGDPAVVNPCGPSRWNAFDVNTGCAFAAPFGNFVTYAWQHEGKHMAEAIRVAKDSVDLDLHALWEPLIGDDEPHLRQRAKGSLGGAHSGITAAAACTHTGQVPGPNWIFWRNPGSGWASDTVAVDESLPGHC